MEALNAEAALRLLREAAAAGDPIDAALLDMQMPDTDGLTLGRQIKADPLVAAKPVTAGAIADVLERWLPSK